MKKISILIILFILTFSISRAQTQANHFSPQYSIGIPLGDMQDFVGETSFRGFALDYRSMLTDNVGLGFDAGVNVFYESRDFASYSEGTETISGFQYRYVNSFPILIAGTYYFSPENKINPFAGLGVGAMYVKHDTDLGLFRYENEDWQFALKPEVGAIYQFSPNVGAKAAAKYYQAFESGDVLGNQSYLTLNVGLVFSNL